MEAAKDIRHGHRNHTMVLVAYRQDLSESRGLTLKDKRLTVIAAPRSLTNKL